MTIRARGTSFQADFMVKGVRYRETFDTYEEAERYEVETKLDLKQGRAPKAAANKRTPSGGRLETLRSLCDHVCKSHWGRMKGGSSAILFAEDAVSYLGPTKRVSDLTTLDLDDYAAFCFDKGNVQGTVNRKLSAISKMLSVALDHGVIDRKPKVPKGKELNQQIRFLTEAEVERLADTASYLGLYEMGVFIIFQVDTGLRLGETLRLRWDHLGPDWKTLTVWESKNNKARTIYTTNTVRVALEKLHGAYPSSHGPFYHWRSDGLLRTSYRHQWNQVCQKAGLEKRIHDLRHTCASRMVQKGIDIRRVQNWMGHSNIQTTLRYAHLAPSDLAACLEALE